MIRSLFAVLVVLLVVLGVAWNYQRSHVATLEAEKEQAQLKAAQAERAAVAAASVKGQAEIAKWKASAARHEAEARQLRTAAAAAATEVQTVTEAGARLVASGTTDEIMAALRARGYTPRTCRP